MVGPGSADSSAARPDIVLPNAARSADDEVPDQRLRLQGTFLQRLLVPTAVSALLLVGALHTRVPLERLDASTVVGAGVHLVLPTAYLVLDPVCRLLDTVSLLTLPQHLALCATLLAGILLRALFAARRQHRMSVWRHARRPAAITALAVALAYFAGALAPRPMLALAVDAPDVLKIDFHSHTSASHDGRPGFDLGHNRAWHAAAGFNAAYVSDHASWNAIKDADRQTPAGAGGTVLLSAMEAGIGHTRVIALGPQSTYASALRGGQLDRTALAAIAAADHRAATLIYTVPESVRELRSRLPPDIPGLTAIEISDASPRGLGQSRQYHDALMAWADTMNIALVAASDNHGWGRTAAAWTLMSLPGWQGMRPPELARAIEDKLHRDGRQATSVVALRPPAGSLSGWQTIATVPVMLWNLDASLSAAERFSWASYVWGLALLRGLWWRRRRGAEKDAWPAAKPSSAGDVLPAPQQ